VDSHASSYDAWDVAGALLDPQQSGAHVQNRDSGRPVLGEKAKHRQLEGERVNRESWHLQLAVKTQPLFRNIYEEGGRVSPGKSHSMRTSIVCPSLCRFLHFSEANLPHGFESHDPDDVKKMNGNCTNGWQTAALAQ
jgi:hypothetical protein